ncbi:MAG: hypothetical protein R3322_00390 [Kiloniellales bacterium]|nr:hypothetical protein [Kiloniellales bacterium]
MTALQKLALDALAVQDACNLCGVAQGFARAMAELTSLGFDTEARNNHPIARVWADKIAHLTGTQSLGAPAVMDAFARVSEMARGE